MHTVEGALAKPVRTGLVGAGRIGTSHATLPVLAGRLGCRALTDTGEDARRVLLVALAAIESVKTATPVLCGKVDPR